MNVHTSILSDSSIQVGSNESKSRKQTGFHNIRLNLTNAESLSKVESQTAADFTATLHWCRMEGKINESQFRAILVAFFDCDPFDVNHEANVKRFKGDPGFKHKAVGTYGQYICWNVEGGAYSVAVCFTGGWLESHELLETLRLVSWLDIEGLHATRIDPAIDDHLKSLDIDALMKALNDKNYSGFQKKEIIFSGDLGGWDGMTFYLGSRQADSMTRIYETSVKHDYAAYRIECELKGEKAKNGFGYLLQEYRRIQHLAILGDAREKQLAKLRMAEVLAKFAVGQINFVDRSGQYQNGSLENCDRLHFWQDLLDKVGEGLKLKVKAKVRTLKKRGDWLLNQVSKTLAFVAEGLSWKDWEKFIDILVRQGTEKLDKESDMWIAELQDKGLEELLGTVTYGS